MQEALAWIFLTLVVLSPLVYWVVGIFYSPLSFPQYCLSCFCNSLTKLLWRVEIEDELPVPPGQGVMLIANHRSSVDPFFVQVAAHRVLHWMIAREYVEHPLAAWFFKQIGAIGTNRGGQDNKAILQAIEYLKSGETIGILPEGRINMTEELLLPIRPGAAMIALKAKVPIVPIYIDGAPYDRVPHSPFMMPCRVKVRIGNPIDLSEFWDQEMNEKTYRKVMLRAVHALAQLAGRDDFQPIFAGRNWKPTAEELEQAFATADRIRKATRN
jgi:1-acyl-sn-glycerol-3-phosphate acyltransferase